MLPTGGERKGSFVLAVFAILMVVAQAHAIYTGKLGLWSVSAISLSTLGLAIGGLLLLAYALSD